jgi:hypothetical protein
MSGSLDALSRRLKQHLGDRARIGSANRLSPPLDRRGQCGGDGSRQAEDRPSQIGHEIVWRLFVIMKDKLEIGGFRLNVAHGKHSGKMNWLKATTLWNKARTMSRLIARERRSISPLERDGLIS